MLRETFQNIVNGIEVRANLIKLKEILREDETKNSHNKEALLYVVAGNDGIFSELLKHEDPKVRKNTAIIMGTLGELKFLELLYDAYEKETQMFVKSSYLQALSNLEYESLLPKLQLRYEELLSIQITEENKKHLTEELRLVEQLILHDAEKMKHRFTGYDCVNELVLLCNRNHIHITSSQLGKAAKKEFTAGVMVKTNQLRDILLIRTYRELLFAVDGMKTVPNDVVFAAKMIADGTILKFLEERHQGEAAYRFRLEIKTKMDNDKKIAFIKRLSSEIEHLSERKLLNSVNHYEFELRLIENKEGKFNVLLRLFTLEDERFNYRKEVLPTSIHPSNAALCVELAKPYLKENAQLLDPFCGVGTMLIERNLAVKAKSMYGIDSLSDAIDKARINTKKADVIVNYINRDFFDFKHEYLFDEIITNMPSVSRLVSERELAQTYKMFFDKAKVHLKEDGILVLYTHNQELVRKYASGRNYRIEKEFEISMMEGTYVYVIRYRS